MIIISKVLKYKYLYIASILILVSIFYLPSYTKAVGQMFSSKLQVSWDDGGVNSVEKRSYIFFREIDGNLEYLNDVGPTKYPLTVREFGYPDLSAYGCEKERSRTEYLIDAGVDTNYPKGWYQIIPDDMLNDARPLLSTDFNWGTATVSWGTQQPYERNCEYAYMYLPQSLSSTDTSNVLVEGNVFSKGLILGKDPAIPDHKYLAISEGALIESEDQISDVTANELTKVGFYQMSDQSTSDKSILNKFKTKLVGDHTSGANKKGFIDEYYNVKYGQSSSFNGAAKNFSISTFDEQLSGDLYKTTDLAKNPDGDVYVIERSEGDLTIDSPVTLPANAQKLVYVEGNLYIKSDINPPSSSTNPDSAILAFVVEGNIIIDGDVKDVERIQAGLISLGGTITFKHLDTTCSGTPNPCRRVDLKGLVIGQYVDFQRDPAKIAFTPSQTAKAGVYIKYNPNIAKLPAFDQLLSAPSIDEASP